VSIMSMVADSSPTRVLLLLGQMPHDSASGAPRSMRTVCEFLGTFGINIVALATTASEKSGDSDRLADLATALPGVRIVQTPGTANEPPILQFVDKEIVYTLLHTGGPLLQWEARHGAQFDRLFDELLQTFRPHIVLTYGGQPPEIARRERAREFGSAVVFGLRNFGYLAAGAFEHVDAVLTGSRFVSDRYHQAIGLESTPLPLPLDPGEVIAQAHQRIFITYINPSVEKGVMFAARLAEELSVRRPDLPMLIVESRGTGNTLVSAGLLGGFDLRRHENLMFCPAVARPAEIYAVARVVIAPSVWEEPAGRIAAEAVVNGIPPVVSDRGGLAEMCGSGGFVLPLPADLTVETRVPVSAAAVEAWLELLIRLCDDEAFYGAACERALAAGAVFERNRVARQYAEYFEGVRAKREREGG
jgi:glycosyltransferase involved in cell wall biosynthesis